MYRFFVPTALLQTERCTLPPDVARQITRVLRLRAGTRVMLFCGDGCEVEAVLEEVGTTLVSARLLGRRTPDVELSCYLHVAVAVLKGEKMEWTVQKLTELGAARISLVQTERTIVAAGEERWPKRLERYRRIAQEAAEQCGRVRVPQISGPYPFHALVQALVQEETGALRLLLDPHAQLSLTSRLQPCPDRVLVLIGPEGGFTQAEAAASLEAGAVPVRLGSRILRAETAALAAATLVAAASEGSGFNHGDTETRRKARRKEEL
jgi:16S rRNA (uracil1498-N3)-methyltransferase